MKMVNEVIEKVVSVRESYTDVICCVVRVICYIHTYHFISFTCSVMSVFEASSSEQRMLCFDKRPISSTSLLKWVLIF